MNDKARLHYFSISKKSELAFIIQTTINATYRKN